MANITAKDVADLRAKTGLGMMDCKKALVESDGDIEKAIKYLREKGLATAAKKEARIAAEGLVDIMVKGDCAAMIEVNTESDFVAKNSNFQEFVKGLLETIIAKQPKDVAELMTLTFADTAETVEATLIGKIAQIGEKLSIRRFVIVNGTVSTYIHGTGVTGVIVKFDVDDAVKANAGFAEMAKNVALQIAAGNPPAYVTKEDVPASVVEEELNIQVAAAKNDPKLAGKPDEVLKKIVAGKMGKLFYERVCLVEQEYVKDDSLTVGKYIAACEKEFGGKIKVVGFNIFEKGEGIAKREEDFAEEIAKMVNKG